MFKRNDLFYQLAVGIIVSALVGCGQDRGLQRVVRVYDGDTIGLANGEKVRLIGIDCPESYESDKLQRDARRSGEPVANILARGRRASEFTRGMVLNKDVFLEFDEERRDKYGRVLAYVWIAFGKEYLQPDTAPEYVVMEEKDGHPGPSLFLNATIMKAGFARPMTIPPNTRHARSLSRYYAEAQAAGRGLYKDLNPSL